MEALSYQERIDRVLRHIESHMDVRLTLNELADMACFSPYHFHRLFTAMVGESPAAYIRRVRLQRAANHIAYTNDSITTIAFTAGYDSIDAFTRAFRAHFGVTPSAYCRTASPVACAIKSNSDEPFFYHIIPDGSQTDIRIEAFSPIAAFAVRHTGSYYECGTAWARLLHVLGTQGMLSATLTGYCIIHDNPDIVAPKKCRMDVCMPLPEGATMDSLPVRHILSNKDIYLKNIGEDYDYAVARIRSPYRLLHSAFRSMYGKWIPQSGRKPANARNFIVFREFSQNVVPLNLMTEVYAPLQPR